MNIATLYARTIQTYIKPPPLPALSVFSLQAEILSGLGRLDLANILPQASIEWMISCTKPQMQGHPSTNEAFSPREIQYI